MVNLLFSLNIYVFMYVCVWILMLEQTESIGISILSGVSIEVFGSDDEQLKGKVNVPNGHTKKSKENPSRKIS